jgi:hypothetical protein
MGNRSGAASLRSGLLHPAAPATPANANSEQRCATTIFDSNFFDSNFKQPKIDLHVIASRRIGAKRRQDTVSRSRGALRPRFAIKFLTLRSEGAGNAGRPMRPIAACAMSVVERTRVSQVTPESPSIPRAMVLRLISCSPRRPGFLATVACGYRFRKLDASVGASGPHVFAVRLNTVRYRRIRVHRIPPRVRDDREPPLCEAGRRIL